MDLKSLSVASFALAFVALCAPTAAKADPIDMFSYQPCSQSTTPPYTCVPTGNTYTWNSPSSPTPVSFIPPGPNPAQGFTIDATVSLNGMLSGSASINFGGSYCGDTGGFNIPSLGIYGCSEQLWTGSTSSPTFLTGTFVESLSDIASPEVGVLTITATSAAEPGTLLLLGSGLLALLAHSFFRFRTSRLGSALS